MVNAQNCASYIRVGCLLETANSSPTIVPSRVFFYVHSCQLELPSDGMLPAGLCLSALHSPCTTTIFCVSRRPVTNLVNPRSSTQRTEYATTSNRTYRRLLARNYTPTTDTPIQII